MSRYIDADALKDKVLKWMPPDPCGIEEREYPLETDIVASLIMEIEEAPTINIVRQKGEWIFNPKDAIDLMFTLPKCNKCGCESADCGNFCPNCGAEMIGDKE